MDQLRELTNFITGEKLRHLGEDVEQLKQTMSLSNDMQQNGASGTNRLPSYDEAQSAEGAGINIDAKKLAAVEIKVGTFEGIVTTLHREIERVLNVLDDRQKDMESIKRDCEEKANKIEELERKLAYSEVQVTQLSQNVLSKDNCSFNGELVWRIENWSEVRAKAVAGTVTSLFSPPFYTSKYGYKMCVRYVSEMIESKDRIPARISLNCNVSQKHCLLVFIIIFPRFGILFIAIFSFFTTGYTQMVMAWAKRHIFPYSSPF